MYSTEIENVYALAFEHQHSFEALELLQPMVEHSRETFEHTIRVCSLSYEFGKHLGLAPQQLELIFDAALVHDLGKLKTPPAILHKSGKLTPLERQVMNQHVQCSYFMTQDIPHLEYASILGSLHHERWDGNGYPLRLKGDETPFEAQIIAIADTWDAMTSTRSYREGMPIKKALRILFSERQKGQFNPMLLDKFITFITTR
ncbi:HD-GYP domain-containing protein [Vibrio lentus]|uniref:HD-GYP domain-containing protein n=1 Tax=Vibrio lentus TaxID=136468 RepID=UPI00097737FB|nr:HD domain-containing phosphohydrolase [Vibrio lentus]OMO20359.1 phosphohydrolase [Vibrio lentus]PMN11117.1 phosphohydrolase [Vibrio lentus]